MYADTLSSYILNNESQYRCVQREITRAKHDDTANIYIIDM